MLTIGTTFVPLTCLSYVDICPSHLFVGVLTDARVPVVHLQEGTRLTGEGAPTRKDLAHWLEEHPGYVEEKPPTLPDAGDKAEVGGMEVRGRSSVVT